MKNLEEKEDHSSSKTLKKMSKSRERINKNTTQNFKRFLVNVCENNYNAFLQQLFSEFGEDLNKLSLNERSFFHKSKSLRN